MLNKKIYRLTFAFVCFLSSCQMGQGTKDVQTKKDEFCFDRGEWQVRDIKIDKLQNGYLKYEVNLDNTCPFSSYVNKEVTFQTPMAINIMYHCEGWRFYYLVNYTPLAKGCIDLLNLPVDDKAKLIGFKGSFYFADEGKGTCASWKIEALVEVRSKFLNNGLPFHIPYDLSGEYEKMETIGQSISVPFRKAPWEPNRTQNDRRVLFNRNEFQASVIHEKTTRKH